MKVACSWSGGKDGCLACWKAISEGHDVRYLVNLVSSGLGRDSFHGVKAGLMAMQAEAAGIPMIQRETTWEGYEGEFRDIMKRLRDEGVEGLVTGDMDIPGHRKWVEDICGEFGLAPLLPLWGLRPDDVLSEFIDDGFEAVVVCIKAEAIGEEWLGRLTDRQFINDWKAINHSPGLNICGENGEYHTFVFDGPVFRQRISLTPGDISRRDGYGFLDIERAELIRKAD